MNIFLFLLLNETMFAIFLTKNLIVCDYLHSFTLNNVLPSEMNSLIFLRKAVSDGSRLVHYAHYAHMYTMLDTWRITHALFSMMPQCTYTHTHTIPIHLNPSQLFFAFYFICFFFFYFLHLLTLHLIWVVIPITIYFIFSSTLSLIFNLNTALIIISNFFFLLSLRYLPVFVWGKNKNEIK